MNLKSGSFALTHYHYSYYYLLIISFTFIHLIKYSYCVQQLKYLWGNALDLDWDDPNIHHKMGPHEKSYPWDEANKVVERHKRSLHLFTTPDEKVENENNLFLTPDETRRILLNVYENNERGLLLELEPFHESHINKAVMTSTSARKGRDIGNQNNNNYYKSPESKSSEGCVPSKLCATSYNTTAPLYGISLTSGKPVTIVQKFPDLLQQVVFQVCKTKECEVLQGECVQTYLPYLFLVIPLGPVTLTGQDYVLVESGCQCRPKYAEISIEPPPIPFIKPLERRNQTNNKRL